MTKNQPAWTRTLDVADAERLVFSLTSKLSELSPSRRTANYEAICYIAGRLAEGQKASAIILYLTDSEKRACIDSERTLSVI